MPFVAALVGPGSSRAETAVPAATLRWTSPFIGAGYNSFTLADLNGDGAVDVVLAANTIQALNGISGTPLWVYRDPAGRAQFGAAPSLADIGLGGKSVVAISGGTDGAACSGSSISGQQTRAAAAHRRRTTTTGLTPASNPARSLTLFTPMPRRRWAVSLRMAAPLSW